MEKKNSIFNITPKMEKYWVERFRRVAKEHLYSTENSSKRLINAYKKSYEEVLKGELLELYEKYSKDGEISYTEMLRYKKLQEMVEIFKEEAMKLGAEEQKFLKNKLPKVIGEVSEETGKIISESFTILPKDTIDKVVNYPWSGKDYSTAIWDNKTKLINTLKTTLVRGIIQGKSVTDMMLAFKTVMEKAEYECRRLIRTETMHMINASQFETYKKLGVKRLKYLTGDIDRTCPKCKEYGMILYFGIDEAPMLPTHPNCRCTYAPDITIYDKITSKFDNSVPVEKVVKKTNGAVKKIFKKYEDVSQLLEKGEMNDVQLAWIDTLTESEYDMINLYTGSSYSKINKILRGIMDKDKWTSYRDVGFDYVINEMDKGLSKYTNHTNFTTYRGVDYNFIENNFKSIYDKLNKHTTGKENLEAMKGLIDEVFIDNGYMSTSPLQQGSFSSDIKLMIDVPEGKGHGAYINKLSNYEDSEYEYLLPRGSAVYITDVYFDDDINRIVVRGKLI